MNYRQSENTFPAGVKISEDWFYVINKLSVPEKLIKHVKKRFAFRDQKATPLHILGREEKNVNLCLYICKQITLTSFFIAFEQKTQHVDGQKEIEIKFYTRDNPGESSMRPWLLEQKSVQATKIPDSQDEILPELLSTYYSKVPVGTPIKKVCEEEVEESFWTPELQKMLAPKENSFSTKKEPLSYNSFNRGQRNEYGCTSILINLQSNPLTLC